MLVARRDALVPAEAWSSIVFRLDPDGQLVSSAHEVIVGVERLLAQRRAIHRLTTDNQITVTCTDDVTELLAEARAESDLFTQILAGTHDGLNEADVERRLADSGFARTLTWFQLRNATRLVNLRLAGLDFSVPGAGKTTTMLAVHALLRQEGIVDRLCVIAPLSAFEAWEDDCVDCFDEPLQLRPFTQRTGSEDAVLIHYQVISQRYDELAAYCRTHNTHLVLDEAHRMKRGRAGQWGRACIDLAFLATRRDVLTGTPAPQSARDLEALLAATWPASSAGLIPPSARQIGAAPDALSQVADRIRPLFVRTTKADLELPEPEVMPVSVAMDGLQTEIYEGLRRRWRDALAAGPADAQVRALGRVTAYLQMAALHPGLLRRALIDQPAHRLEWPLSEVPNDLDLIGKIDRYGKHEHPAKYARLLGMIQQNRNAGRKTLVWTTFVESVEIIARDYLHAFAPAVVHGATPVQGDDDDPATRRNQISRFRNDPDCWVLVANPAAMSEGISLHRECHEAIYVDRSFNAGQFLQSVDRIHRLGLDPAEHTRIRILSCPGTVDEVIGQRLAVKTEALSRMLDDPELALLRLTDEEDDVYDLDEQDRDALLAHLASRD